MQALRIKITAESALSNGFLLQKQDLCNTLGNSGVRKGQEKENYAHFFSPNMNRYEIKLKNQNMLRNFPSILRHNKTSIKDK